MENLLQTNGESIPPVPAPRNKRKLIANEDSKILSNKDTCMNEKIVVIAPPPRRKNKVHYNIVNTNTIPVTPSKPTHYSSIQGSQANNESYTLDNSFSNTSFKTKDIVITKTNRKIYSELEEDHTKSCFHKLVNKDDCDIIDEFSNCESKMSPSLGEYKERHIFDNSAENRVLGTTLENISISRVNSSSQKQFDQHFAKEEETEKDRVKCKLSENSATIVGVFYKPTCTVRHEKLMNEEQLFCHPQNKELCPMHLSSNMNYGNNSAALVPLGSLGDYKKTFSKNMIKDSDENDSGVYFSDTKSPPHVGKVLKSTFVNDRQKTSTDENSDIAFYKAFPCNAGDTIDNNSSEESGPQNYQMMLDYFEGQTVKSFREQLASQFQLSNKEINKERAVENWLQVEKDGSEKKESSLSLYLKSMLENENDKESLSPYSLSTVDEDEKSDTLFEEFKESKMIEDLNEKKSVPDTCTVPVRLETSNNDRMLAPDNLVDSVVDTNCVNIYSVNIDSNVNFDKYNVNVTDCTIKTKKIGGSSLNETLSIIPDGFGTASLSNKLTYNLSKVTDESVDSNDHLHYDSDMSVENIHPPPLPSEPPGNAVTSLIEFFENTKKKEATPWYFECRQAEEDIEEENMHESDENNVVVQGNVEWNSGKCEEEIPRIQDVNRVIASKTNSTLCPDTGCKDGELSIKDTPTVNESRILIEENTIDCDLKLESSDNSIEYTTTSFGLNEKELNPTCNKTDNSFPLHDCSFHLPIESRHLLENQELAVVKRIEHDGYDSSKFNHNVYFNSSNNVICNETDDSSKTTERGNNQVHVSHDSSFCRDSYNFLTTGNVHKDESHTLECSSDLYGTIKMSGDKIINSKHKLTRIPIVTFTDSDLINSSPIGSVELYPPDILQCCTDLSIDIRDVNEGVTVFSDVSNNSFKNTNLNSTQDDDSLLMNTVEVIMEKNWGSVGLKLEGDEQGVQISDVLAGGAANQSGLVFKGWVDIKTMREEMEIFC